VLKYHVIKLSITIIIKVFDYWILASHRLSILTTSVFLRSSILTASRSRFRKTTTIRPRQLGMSKCKQLYNASPQKKSSCDHLSHSTRSSQRSNECARSHRSCTSLRDRERSSQNILEIVWITDIRNKIAMSFIMKMLIKYFADSIIYIYIFLFPRERQIMAYSLLDRVWFKSTFAFFLGRSRTCYLL